MGSLAGNLGGRLWLRLVDKRLYELYRRSGILRVTFDLQFDLIFGLDFHDFVSVDACKTIIKLRQI